MRDVILDSSCTPQTPSRIKGRQLLRREGDKKKGSARKTGSRREKNKMKNRRKVMDSKV